MALIERLTELSDNELNTLQGNAERLLASGTAPQRVSAEAILPKVTEEISRRSALVDAEKERKRLEKAAARPVKKRKAKAEETAS